LRATTHENKEAAAANRGCTKKFRDPQAKGKKRRIIRRFHVIERGWGRKKESSRDWRRGRRKRSSSNQEEGKIHAAKGGEGLLSLKVGRGFVTGKKGEGGYACDGGGVPGREIPVTM